MGILDKLNLPDDLPKSDKPDKTKKKTLPISDTIRVYAPAEFFDKQRFPRVPKDNIVTVYGPAEDLVEWQPVQTSTTTTTISKDIEEDPIDVYGPAEWFNGSNSNPVDLEVPDVLNIEEPLPPQQDTPPVAVYGPAEGFNPIPVPNANVPEPEEKD